MTFAVHGLPVARGIAIGRAVLVVSSRIDVAHYFIKPEEIETEIDRVRTARNAVADELAKLQTSVAQMGPNDAPHELAALLEVHQMLLQDEALTGGVKHWITDRLYNAEWALTTQLEIIARQFDEMEDEYLRERKADLEQVVERILRYMKGVASPVAPPASSPRRKTQQDLLLDDTVDVPLVLVAHDLSPADMLQFKQSVFAGFVTDVGGKTSHTAIVARSMDIPAIVGARSASQLVRQDDWVIIDGEAGVMIIDPSPIILAEYGFKQRQGDLERGRLARLRHKPAVTLDGQRVDLLSARMVCGAANNQLAHPGVEKRLADRGVLYAPDYVVNAGGVIQVADEISGFVFERARAKATRIFDTTRRIVALAEADGVPPAVAADRLAELRMADVGRLRGFWLP